MRGRERLDRHDAIEREADDATRLLPTQLLGGIARPLPRDELAAIHQERRRVLDEHGQGGEPRGP